MAGGPILGETVCQKHMIRFWLLFDPGGITSLYRSEYTGYFPLNLCGFVLTLCYAK
jgi:hypothetical protein